MPRVRLKISNLRRLVGLSDPRNIETRMVRFKPESIAKPQSSNSGHQIAANFIGARGTNTQSICRRMFWQSPSEAINR